MGTGRNPKSPFCKALDYHADSMSLVSPNLCIQTGYVYHQLSSAQGDKYTHSTPLAKSYSLPLCQQVGHLWRQHQRASVVPPVEVDQRNSRLLWQVLVDKMPGFGEYLEGILACWE
jgi:hypothetical protein